jgi:hypothetical protein
MRRLSIFVSVLLIAIVGIMAAGHSFTSVQAQSSTSMAGHPLVGSWNANTDVSNPSNPPSLFIFTSDGIYTEVDADGTTAIGSWQATGPNTANLTALEHQTDDNGKFVGTLIIRASITVSADGQSFTAPYTLELTPPLAGGTSTGQAGPGMASGTKIAVEPMGTPVMTIQEFENGGPSQATPAP